MKIRVELNEIKYEDAKKIMQMLTPENENFLTELSNEGLIIEGDIEKFTSIYNVIDEFLKIIDIYEKISEI
ncbi:hypothetical protein [Caldiplasma sukawensis]